MIIGDGIELTEFVHRRERVLEELDGAVGVVFAGDGSPPLTGAWEPDFNFQYLTGIRDEAGAAVLFDPRAEDPKRRCILLLRPLNPEAEDWDGLRDRIGSGLKAATGFEAVMRTGALPRALTTIARRRGRMACLHPFAVYDAPVSPDLALFRRVADRCVGLSILDRTDLLASLRAVKSEAEIAQMKHAISATGAGFRAAMAMMRPGSTERQVQHAIEEAFRAHGASGPAYNPIVGTGVNGTVLHYMANNAPIAEADMVVIDAGARFGAYTADVTRTLPASGRFAPQQREVYTTVLRALDAAIEAARPGVMMHQVDAAARRIIDAAGFADFFPHGIGHQLGMEVHDVTPDGPLREGMVITVEPGVYLRDRAIAVRIEDDVLITASGPVNLTASIPRTVEQVEAAMAR